tara:strand:- start:403 stop:639 length:237 start_codon:yes stop_codon:yes gene_type:complete
MYSIDEKACSSVFEYGIINQIPDTIWMIKVTAANAPNKYQKLTLDGTGCLERCLSKVFAIGSLLLTHENNFPAISLIL